MAGGMGLATGISAGKSLPLVDGNNSPACPCSSPSPTLSIFPCFVGVTNSEGENKRTCF